MVTRDKFKSKANIKFSAVELKVQLRTQIPDRELQVWSRQLACFSHISEIGVCVTREDTACICAIESWEGVFLMILTCSKQFGKTVRKQGGISVLRFAGWGSLHCHTYAFDFY